MKSILLLTLFAADAFQDHEHLREIMETKHLHGDEDAARQAAANLPDDGDIAETVKEEGLDQRAGKAPDPAELAYATGVKREIYCRGKGLVFADSEHADGSTSRLRLISESRSMAPEAYAQMHGGGQWIYEYGNKFREPTRSEVWQTWGKPNGFNIFEVRRHSQSKIDQGSWSAEWRGPENHGTHYSVNTSSAPEPVNSLIMATQYQMWGSPRLGFDIDFRPRYKDSVHFNAIGRKSGRFILRADREITKHLETFAYKDAEGDGHGYDDCYELTLKIAADAQ
jgi:hypothetical protein